MPLNWIESAHDHAKALALAKASFAAYGSKKERENWAREHDFGAVWTLEWGHLSGFAVLHREQPAMVVCFQGTNQLTDWGNNLDLDFSKAKRFPSGRVHDGFDRGVDHLWSQIEAATANPAEARLWFTGHSLGGALATIAAARMSEAGREVAGAYTFGAPRVGDAAFTNWLNARLAGRLFRYVNAADPVTQVPPATAYSDVGQAFIMDGAGLREMADNLFVTAARIGLKLMPVLLQGNGRDALRTVVDVAIRDGKSEHNMGLYIERVSRLA